MWTTEYNRLTPPITYQLDILQGVEYLTASQHDLAGFLIT